MNKDRLILAVGAGSLLLGAAWVIYAIYGWVSPSGFAMDEGWLEILFSVFFLFFLFLLTLPGGLAIYHGVSLLKQSSRSGIKGAVAGVVVMGAIAFNAWVGVAFTRIFHDPNSDFVFMITDVLLMITCLIVLWLYIALSRALIARAGLGYARIGELIGKGTALLFAFLLWFTCDTAIDFFVPTLASDDPGWWGLLQIVAIVVAWWTYIFTASFIEHHKSPETTGGEPRAQAGASA